MTDPNIPDPAAQYSAAPAYAPAPVGVKQGISLASFITGLAGIVFCWVPGLGFLSGLAGVILGFVGRKSEPAAPRWMSLVGIITGFVAIALNIIFLVAVVILPLIFSAAVLSNCGTYCN